MKDFSKIYLLKGLKPKNKGHTNFYECCDLTKKVYLVYNCNVCVLLLLFLLGSAVLHTLHTSTTTYFEIQTKSFFYSTVVSEKENIMGRHRMTEKYLKFPLFFMEKRVSRAGKF